MHKTFLYAAPFFSRPAAESRPNRGPFLCKAKNQITLISFLSCREQQPDWERERREKANRQKSPFRISRDVDANDKWAQLIHVRTRVPISNLPLSLSYTRMHTYASINSWQRWGGGAEDLLALSTGGRVEWKEYLEINGKAAFSAAAKVIFHLSIKTFRTNEKRADFISE